MRKDHERFRANRAGVIFDMDGVLVDSSTAHWRSWVRLGEEIGAPYPREVFERTFGMHNRQIIPLWLGDDMPAEEIDRLSDRKEAMYREEARGSLRPLEGAVDLIRALHAAEFRLAVGSSGPKANVDLVLEILGVTELFHELSTGDEVRHGKPNPEVFLKAAAKLGLPPGRCAVIEDAPQGVKAGLAAGSRVIAVTSTRPAEELRDAHRVVASLRDLDPAEVGALIDGARLEDARD